MRRKFVHHWNVQPSRALWFLMKPFHNTHPNEIIVARGAGGIVTETSACASAGANEAVTFDGNVGDDESYFSVGWR